MKHAGILSGGGAKGSYQLGATFGLLEKGIEFDVVSGISVGALNASFIGQRKYDEMEKLWLSTGDNEGGTITNGGLATIKDGGLKPDFSVIKDVMMQGVSKFDVVKAITSSFFKGRDLERVGTQILDNLDYSQSILDNSPLHQVLTDNVKLSDFKIPFYFGLTAMGSGKGWEFNNKDFGADKHLVNAILASATMPIIWESVPKILTKKGVVTDLVDGGLRTVSPIGQVFDTVEKSNDDWTFWLLNCNSKILPAMEDTRRKSVKAGRILDILLNQVFNDDVDRTIEINKFAKQLGKREVIINIIEPETGTIGATLDFRKETMLQRIEMGRLAVSNFL